MAFRNKEMLLMQASKPCELPKPTLKGRVNNKEQNTEKLVRVRSYSKPVLSEADCRPSLGRGYVGEIGNIVFLISQTGVFHYSLNKGLFYPAWSRLGT